MKNIKRGFCIIILCSVGLVFWWTGMNYTGYCHNAKRYFSNDEIINSAIVYVISRYPPSLEKKNLVLKNGVEAYNVNWYMPKNPIRYSGVEEFKKLNPSCCEHVMELDNQGDELGMLDKLTGNFFGYVVVNYKVRYLDEDHIEKIKHSSMVVTMTNCAKAWN